MRLFKSTLSLAVNPLTAMVEVTLFEVIIIMIIGQMTDNLERVALIVAAINFIAMVISLALSENSQSQKVKGFFDGIIAWSLLACVAAICIPGLAHDMTHPDNPYANTAVAHNSAVNIGVIILILIFIALLKRKSDIGLMAIFAALILLLVEAMFVAMAGKKIGIASSWAWAILGFMAVLCLLFAKRVSRVDRHATETPSRKQNRNLASIIYTKMLWLIQKVLRTIGKIAILVFLAWLFIGAVILALIAVAIPTGVFFLILAILGPVFIGVGILPEPFNQWIAELILGMVILGFVFWLAFSAFDGMCHLKYMWQRSKSLWKRQNNAE